MGFKQQTPGLLGLCILILTGGAIGDNLENYADPPSSARPYFRYWFPDASVPSQSVVRDIEEAKNVGAGGVEFVPFYNYGGILAAPPPGVDWSLNGFGTPSFKALFKDALKTHAKNGMLMDFAIGPNQGQGVPSSPDAEGLQWDLIPFSAQIGANTANRTIPGWGTGGDLVAVVSATAIQSTNVSFGTGSYTQLLVKQNTLSVLTEDVMPDGRLSANNSLLNSGENVWIFAFYQRRSLYRNVRFPNNRSSTIFDNGSFSVDHFSAKGAQHTIAFWEQYILDEEIEPLLKLVGRNGWEDSLELISHVSWTPGLSVSFEQQHGYSLHRWLPLIMWQNNNLAIQENEPGAIRVIVDTEDEGAGYINDYRASLQKGYQEYLTTISTWLRERLGLSFRTQVSYNMPMEMADSIPFADVPECESLGFPTLDAYRQFTGAAILSGKNIISNEMGAVFGSAYSQTIPSLLNLTHVAFSAGVNQLVLHALSYSGNYSGSTWPGLTGFNYFVSELYSNKQPAWENGLDEAMTYLARIQYIQQAGVARPDVAIYYHVSANDPKLPVVYTSKNLENDGYTYRYLSPGNLKLPEAHVRGGTLAPEGPAFKALILINGTQLTSEGVRTLTELARQGLHLIMEGEQAVYPSGDGADKGATISEIGVLVKNPNVHLVKYGEAAKMLSSLDIQPFAKVQSNDTWITNHRYDVNSDVDYVFVHGPPSTSSGNLVVVHTGNPYYLDPWSGEKRPVVVYERDSERKMLTIPIEFGPSQAKTFAFSHTNCLGVESPEQQLSKVSREVGGASYDPVEQSIVLQVTANKREAKDKTSVKFQNGTTVNLTETRVAVPFQLNNWNLTVEHWEAPNDLYNAAAIARKRNTTHQVTAPLKSWTELDTVIRNASGLGYYETTLNWPPQNGGTGAYLKLSIVLHAVKVYINGEKMAPVDPFHPEIDIGPYLRNGSNHVLLVVPSVMWNYLRSILGDLETSGMPPLTLPPSLAVTFKFPFPPITTNGLLGNVTIEPYDEVRLALK
ncbi:hypothetical protein IQ07DRAFT_546683 [Pyrenochaeta sp. DS3sAY3a]|nr:hypothetical protein IQ07DRAFT_546683 [Pyrenochaeta sp. DS3sAY3a]